MFIRYRAFLFFFLFSLLCAVPSALRAQGCDSLNYTERRQNMSQIEKGGLSFSFRFFRTMMDMEGKKGNLCVSPFSAGLALAAALNGAEGETRTQMLEALGLSGMTPEQIACTCRELIRFFGAPRADLQFNIANSIWIRQGLPVHDAFIAANRLALEAEVATLDFSDRKASGTINAWVKEKTEGKISGIVPDRIPRGAMLYLINALYFKGMWQTGFDRKETRKEEFTLPDGKTIRHDMMKAEGKFAYALLKDSTQIIALPYKVEKGEFDMVVILPPAGTDIDEYLRAFDERSFYKQFDALDRGEREGTLYLPKFRLEYEATLNDGLIAMGMERAFNGSPDPETGAEFGGISDVPLYISNVRQKTFVEVNEEGTEAAAVTAVQMDQALSPSSAPPPFVMRADRPFIFFIGSSDPDVLLFCGKVVDPR